VSPPNEYVYKEYIQNNEIKITNYHSFKFFKPDTDNILALYHAQELADEGKKEEIELIQNGDKIKADSLLLPFYNTSVYANEDGWISKILGEDFGEEDED